MSDFVKIKIAECRSTGNLRADGHSQSYYCFFYPRVLHDGEVTLTDKAVVELVTPSERDSGESVVRSYRMVDPSQVKLLALDVIKLYAFFLKRQDRLDVNYRYADLMKDILKVFKDVKEGVYDEGI